MHVHRVFRHDLGPVRLGGHRRDVSTSHARKAGVARDCRELARYVHPPLISVLDLTPAGNFLIGFLTPFANDGIGYAFGFVFFGCNLAAALIVWFFMYETKSLSLENVDTMYQEPGLKAWRSSKWVPPGYLDRKTRDEAYWQRRASLGGTGGLAAREADKLEGHSKYETEGEKLA